MLSIKKRCKDTAFFWIMQEKMHFSYDFLIRSTRFSYKILYISTRFSDFESKSSSRCPCSIPEDMPIDLRVIRANKRDRKPVDRR